MSTVIASYTPLCRSPVLPAPSGMRSASHPWRPAAAFPASVAVKCRRPLSVTCFSIPPTALLYPVPPPDGKERWGIEDLGDHVKLWFQVPGLSEKDLDINVSEDMLEIKRKDAKIGDGAVGSFHVRLLMTREYDTKNVKAELKAGMLEVTVGKSKERKVSKVLFGSQSPDQDATSTGPGVSATTGVSSTSKDLNKEHKSPVPGPRADATRAGSRTTKDPSKDHKSSDPGPGAGAKSPGTGPSAGATTGSVSGTTKDPNKDDKSTDPGPGAGTTTAGSGTTKDPNKDDKSTDPGPGAGTTTEGSGTTKDPSKDHKSLDPGAGAGAKSPGTGPGAGATTGVSGTTKDSNKDHKSPDPGPGAGTKSPGTGHGAGTTTGVSDTTKDPNKDNKSPDLGPRAGATTTGSDATTGDAEQKKSTK